MESSTDGSSDSSGRTSLWSSAGWTYAIRVASAAAGGGGSVDSPLK